MEVLPDFYPRPPRGGRPRTAKKEDASPAISIHALREEGDLHPDQRKGQVRSISIHALREEGDSVRPVAVHTVRISIHALREEGDSTKPRATSPLKISIHALREEGDLGDAEKANTALEFLSTPSARRATSGSTLSVSASAISIHALREEGDVQADSLRHPGAISIHALREEGDMQALFLLDDRTQFLSTPSARRATRSASLARVGLKSFLSTPSARRATVFTMEY